MTDVSPLLTLAAIAVSAAATQTTAPLTGLNGLSGLSGSIRFAGTGGTSVDVYVQTSLDGGTTWADRYNAHFTASGVSEFSLSQGAAANLAVTDGTLAANTALNSGTVPLFDQYRVKIISVGTWTNGVVSAYVMPRG